jgi:uncharacterized protein (TIGR02996 family)
VTLLDDPTDHAALLRAIAATPECRLTRLVYADFLEERETEDYLLARAEWIRAWAEGDEAEWLRTNRERVATKVGEWRGQHTDLRRWWQSHPDGITFQATTPFARDYAVSLDCEMSGGFVTHVRAETLSALTDGDTAAGILLAEPLCRFTYSDVAHSIRDTALAGGMVRRTVLYGPARVVLAANALLTHHVGQPAELRTAGHDQDYQLSRTDAYPEGTQVAPTHNPHLCMILAWQAEWPRRAQALRARRLRGRP